MDWLEVILECIADVIEYVVFKKGKKERFDFQKKFLFLHGYFAKNKV